MLNKFCYFCFLSAQKSVFVASQNWSWVTDVTWTVLLMYLLCFWTWEHFSCVAVYGGSESSQISSKHLNLCPEDERRSHGFGTTWGRVINDRIIILGWTNPLMLSGSKKVGVETIFTQKRLHFQTITNKQQLNLECWSRKTEKEHQQCPFRSISLAKCYFRWKLKTVLDHTNTRPDHMHGLDRVQTICQWFCLSGAFGAILTPRDVCGRGYWREASCHLV